MVRSRTARHLQIREEVAFVPMGGLGLRRRAPQPPEAAMRAVLRLRPDCAAPQLRRRPALAFAAAAPSSAHTRPLTGEGEEGDAAPRWLPLPQLQGRRNRAVRFLRRRSGGERGGGGAEEVGLLFY